ncbi:hypothetical protein QBC37DRAFT_397399 [Rhypophila decipiens]|uniref:Uncharacterized protein n=1 Tax=Rhypophila decipiens TaxID=261697 RepID=A0AAN6YD13_9PEZI|nr:hypothetical protein QBC37DRAFT_397399 [Rhypophila decipiens]
MEPPGYTPASPSLKGLPTETITQIYEDLEPVEVASLRQNKGLADIGRPFLAPKHYKLNFSAYSIERLHTFATDAQWRRRIEEITYNVGDRLATPSVAQWDRAGFYTILEAEDDFSDREAKRVTFRTYNKWITDQRSDEKMRMTSDYVDWQVIKKVTGEQGLPNLHSFNVATLPCMARGNSPRGINKAIKPHGYSELRSLLKGLSKHLGEKCSILRAVGMDQRLFQRFHGVNGWRPFEEIPTITSLELLIKDEYCQATLVHWQMPMLPEFLGLFPNLEELTLGLDCCREMDCLGQFYAPPTYDHRARFLDLTHSDLVSHDISQPGMEIIDADPTDNRFRMRNLRRLTLSNVAWNRQQMIQFIHFHKDTLEQVTVADCQFDRSRWGTMPEPPDLKTLVDELKAYSHIHFSISNILGRENSVFIYEHYDNDDRESFRWVLRRKNGKDYRVTDLSNALDIRKQVGGGYRGGPSPGLRDPRRVD